MMAHPCSRDQGVFHLAVDECGTMADPGPGMNAAPLLRVP